MKKGRKGWKRWRKQCEVGGKERIRQRKEGRMEGLTQSNEGRDKVK